ncbi:hypothetical protein, partial [Thermoflexus sp.]|uniref:hypothetical protein n=1 Tax=Thermoflexus sp. TaxID=1969742 RepID=UPI002ADDA517
MERIRDLAILYANGWIAIGLFLLDRLFPLAILLLSGAWAGLIERGLMAAAAFSPPRSGAPSPRRPVSPAPMVLGGLAGILSVLAAALYPAPIPQILAAM